MAVLNQNQPYVRLFDLKLASDHYSPATGKTPTVQLSKAGGAPGTAAGTVLEIGSGKYKVSLTAADTNTVGDLGFVITASGCDQVSFTDQVSLPSFVLYSGVATGGGLNQLTVDSTAIQIAFDNVGATLVLTNGTGAGQARSIASANLINNQITPDAGWNVTPNNTTQYSILAIRCPAISSDGTAGVILSTQSMNALLDLPQGIDPASSPGETIRKAIRLILAATAGPRSGAGTTTNTLKDTSGTKNRIVAAMDSSGNVASPSYDAS